MKEKQVSTQFSGSLVNRVFESIEFTDLEVRDCHVSQTRFSKCQFKNSYLGLGSTKYENVTFHTCKFFGKYSSLGTLVKSGPTFHNCRFEECAFSGTEIFGSAKFLNCYFSGTLDSVILRDKANIGEFEGVRFKECDLSGLNIQNVSIYYANVFLKSKLPLEQLLILDNRNNVLVDRTETELKNGSEALTELKVLFSRSIFDGHEKIILSRHFLSGFLKNDLQWETFERIVEGRKIS